MKCALLRGKRKKIVWNLGKSWSSFERNHLVRGINLVAKTA
jgi:hypothetical protein